MGSIMKGEEFLGSSLSPIEEDTIMGRRASNKFKKLYHGSLL